MGELYRVIPGGRSPPGMARGLIALTQEAIAGLWTLIGEVRQG
ncbi:MAG: hypothetical protein ACRC8Y_03180 [Chroococcales cyanobacterium]